MTKNNEEKLKAEVLKAMTKIVEGGSEKGMFESMLLTPSVEVYMTDAAMNVVKSLDGYCAELVDMGNITE